MNTENIYYQDVDGTEMRKFFLNNFNDYFVDIVLGHTHACIQNIM